MRLQRGFTMIELIIFVAIFAIAMGAFLSIFMDVSGVAVRQSAIAEVQGQSQFLLQTIKYYVEKSSMVSTTVNESVPTLVLRMPSSTEDPVVFSMSGNTVQLKIGAAATQNITSDKVEVSDLLFTRHSHPGAKNSVSVSFAIAYATDNLKQSFATALLTSVARVSAATFDSDIVPDVGSTHELGTSQEHWRGINNTIFFSGANVGIGTASPGAELEVDGDIAISGSSDGLILNDGDSCWRVRVSNAGALTTATATCP